MRLQRSRWPLRDDRSVLRLLRLLPRPQRHLPRQRHLRHVRSGRHVVRWWRRQQLLQRRVQLRDAAMRMRHHGRAVHDGPRLLHRRDLLPRHVLHQHGQPLYGRRPVLWWRRLQLVDAHLRLLGRRRSVRPRGRLLHRRLQLPRSVRLHHDGRVQHGDRLLRRPVQRRNARVRLLGDRRRMRDGRRLLLGLDVRPDEPLLQADRRDVRSELRVLQRLVQGQQAVQLGAAERSRQASRSAGCLRVCGGSSCDSFTWPVVSP